MELTDRLRKAIREVPDFPKPGISFKDISPVLESPELSRDVVAYFAQRFSRDGINAVAGIESRGFLFGMALAIEMEVPFLLVRKKGKLPAETVSHRYDLEYGSAEIEMHTGVIKDDWKVLIHDDLLATGGTARATAELVKKSGGQVAAYAFLIELGYLEGREALQPFDGDIVSLVNY